MDLSDDTYESLDDEDKESILENIHELKNELRDAKEKLTPKDIERFTVRLQHCYRKYSLKKLLSKSPKYLVQNFEDMSRNETLRHLSGIEDQAKYSGIAELRQFREDINIILLTSYENDEGIYESAKKLKNRVRAAQRIPADQKQLQFEAA